MTPVSGVASSNAVKAKETVVVFWQDLNQRFGLKHKYSIVANSDRGLALQLKMATVRPC